MVFKRCFDQSFGSLLIHPSHRLVAWTAGRVGRLFTKILMGMLLKIVELLKAKEFNVMAKVLPAVWHDAPVWEL